MSKYKLGVLILLVAIMVSSAGLIIGLGYSCHRTAYKRVCGPMSVLEVGECSRNVLGRVECKVKIKEGYTTTSVPVKVGSELEDRCVWVEEK